MEFNELLEFVTVENKRLSAKYNVEPGHGVLARTVKLGEEVGELCAEILAHQSLQRTEKLEKSSNDTLSEELADVLITTLLVAGSLNVDVKTALRKKMEKINARYH
ncbi:hypothetical protein J4219_03460 [Candidatus Woesearchaeota archaeon]|nr:hypothetical protein [Candidatus Woesearchaeota archaeon]